MDHTPKEVKDFIISKIKEIYNTRKEKRDRIIRETNKYLFKVLDKDEKFDKEVINLILKEAEESDDIILKHVAYNILSSIIKTTIKGE